MFIETTALIIVTKCYGLSKNPCSPRI